MQVEVSNGELVDKVTILKIKASFAGNDLVKAAHIEKELGVLQPEMDKLAVPRNIIADLQKVNKKLWDIEDKIRQCEKDENFDEHFIKLARSIYQYNDQRFAIKSKINDMTQSAIKEQKILPEYK